jgi:hypothetical protein
MRVSFSSMGSKKSDDGMLPFRLLVDTSMFASLLQLPREAGKGPES